VDEGVLGVGNRCLRKRHVHRPGPLADRYRLDADSFGFALSRVTWTRDGDFFGAGNFTANASTALRTYGVPDGAGTYRLSVSPYAGSRWYVEVDAFR
jgi:hypothetical protein